MSFCSLGPNKSLTFICLQILLSTILVACLSKNDPSVNPPSFSDGHIYADLSKIDSLLAYQEERWNSGDIEGFMDSYWKSDSLRFASGGTVRNGWIDTIQRYRETYPDRARMGRLKFQSIKREMLGEDVAMVLGSWDLEREVGNIGGLYTLILKKVGDHDDWKIVHDHTSSRPVSE